MVACFHRVGQVEKMPDVSDADKRKLRKAVEEIADLFSEVVQLSDSRPTAIELVEQLIASHAQLREEMVKVNQMLEGITTRTESL
jgi:methylthioribose-1-phosphate isomerase